MDKLLKLLYDEAMITEEQYQQVLKECERSMSSCDTVLEKYGFLREQDLLTFLGEKFHLSVVNWDRYHSDPDLLELIPKHVAQSNIRSSHMRLNAVSGRIKLLWPLLTLQIYQPLMILPL